MEYHAPLPEVYEPTPPPPPPQPFPTRLKLNWPLHIALFGLTIASTTLTNGPLYAAAVLTILLSHEMGHFLTARRYHVPATLPYFIPMPPQVSLFGTMGAVIRMVTLGSNRRVLFDIAAWGPIAGMIVAIPVSVIGLKMSTVVEKASATGANINLGSSLLFQWLTDLVFGKLPPEKTVMLHPVAFAGWAGFFVTSLNLIPVGQLDGGHIAYALLGKKAHWLAMLVAIAFVSMAIFVSPAWGLLAFMIILFGIRHPPTGDDTVPIGRTRVITGIALLLLFVLTFTPRIIE